MMRRPTIGLCIVWLCASAWAAEDAGPPAWPGVQGAVFAMRDCNIGSTLAAFDVKGRELLAFNCAPRGRGLIGRNFDLVCDGGSFHARNAGAWVGMQLAKSGTFTIEVTITPEEAKPKTPGVVLALGDDKCEDVALVQNETGLGLRLGGTDKMELFTPAAGQPVHVLVSCDKEKWSVYRFGKLVRSGVRRAGGAAWGARELVFGAAWSGVEPWRGRLEAIAIFPVALTAEQAAGEADAIVRSLAARKAPTVIRFRGTLLRQAKTADLKQIAPYTRSLTAAEYKVDKVLAGQWKQPTITVLQWMIMDGRRLPLADRARGAEVELSVEPLAENPQLEACRRDDEIDGDVATDLYYCESETPKCQTGEREIRRDQQ